MVKPVVLVGTLHGGIVGPGGETTGYALKVGAVNVDVAGVTNASTFSAQHCLVAGDFEERAYPLRGRIRVLRAREIVEGASALTRSGLRSSVYLSGTLHTNIIHIGGEGPNAELTGVIQEIDVSAVKIDGLLNKPVIAVGSFDLVPYITRGLQAVFKATGLKNQVPPVAFSARKATNDAEIVHVQGISSKFSLEDAILDAVSHLPMTDIAADWLTQIHVDSIGADFGGIAGISVLRVTISAAIPKTLSPLVVSGGGGQPDPLFAAERSAGGGVGNG